MNRADILQDLFKILRRYEGRGANRASLTESTSLSKELDIDSARMVDIVLDVEQQFGVTIDDQQLPKLDTVKEIVDLVEGLIKSQKGS
jgi:acyl carrier protein